MPVKRHPSILYSAFDVVPSPKGASTHISAFVRGLVRSGFAVTLLTAGDGCLPEEDGYLGARMLRFCSAETNYLDRALSFGQAVRGHITAHGQDYDIAHFRCIWSGVHLLDLKERFGYRTLFEVNGLPGIELKYHFPALRGSPTLDKIRQQETAILLKADHIICPSAVTAAYVTSLGATLHRITVIPNGIDPELFAPQPLPRPQPPVILYVGTLAAWQGLEILLEALPLVLAKRSAQLWIVGKGRKERQKSLLKIIHKNGLEPYVSLREAHGHHTIPELVNQAAVCVAPLAFNDRNVTQGCCPIKILEYAACARPVVAANLPVVRELARDGAEAWLFTPDDPDDLARCILAVLEDEPWAQNVADAYCRRVHEQFTWKAAQKRLIRVYRELLSER